MKTIDPTVLAGYNAGIERDRLRTGIGLIEFERTKEILLEKNIDSLIELNSGDDAATAWGCDLTYDYVKINGDYRT